MSRLTPKQAAFVQEYLIDLNASAAAIRAGYSPKTAGRTGHENLKKPEIAAEIQKAMAERSKRTEITADRVLEEIAKMAFANLTDYFRIQPDGTPYIDLSNLTPDQGAALTEIQVDAFMTGKGDDAAEVQRVKIKMADKRANLELLARHLRLFGPGSNAQDAAGELDAIARALQQADNAGPPVLN